VDHWRGEGEKEYWATVLSPIETWFSVPGLHLGAVDWSRECATVPYARVLFWCTLLTVDCWRMSPSRSNEVTSRETDVPIARGPRWVGSHNMALYSTELDWTTEHTSHVGYWAWLG
jgi:hypothetical protein